MNWLTSLALLLAILLPATSLAAPWYRIELMLVAYTQPESDGSEQWPVAIDSPPPLALEKDPADVNWWLTPKGDHSANSALLARFGFSDIPNASWPAAFTEQSVLELRDPADRVRWRDDMQLVFHKAWIEPIQEQGKAIQHPLNLHLSGALSMDIRGNFSVHISRYLHFNTDLVVQHYKPNPNLLMPTAMAASPATPTDLLSSLYQRQLVPYAEAQLPLRAAHVKQSRRMRSGELHYVDHPLLGAVVKVIPIENADDLNGEPVN